MPGMACGDGAAGAGVAGATCEGAAVLGEDDVAGACAPAGVDRARSATTAVALIRWLIMADLSFGSRDGHGGSRFPLFDDTTPPLRAAFPENEEDPLNQLIAARCPEGARRATRDEMPVLWRRFHSFSGRAGFWRRPAAQSGHGERRYIRLSSVLVIGNALRLRTTRL